MQDHFDLPDIEFEQQFENCSMDPGLFSHEAHLRLAWIHINKYGLDQASQNIEGQLKAFVRHVGAADKYHHTVTLVGVNAVHHFIKRSKSETSKDFINEFPVLKTNFKELVNSHYSMDIFSSDEARNGYMAPDLSPFN